MNASEEILKRYFTSQQSLAIRKTLIRQQDQHQKCAKPIYLADEGLMNQPTNLK